MTGGGVGSTWRVPKKNEPVDARVRLAISQWPEDAPRGAVTTFCAEHQITRKTFYAILARARTEGQVAALEPRSRRPHTSPARIGEDAKEQAVRVRAALEASGLDHGPISVHDKLVSLGMDAPSVASLARIFRAKDVARAEPKKKPEWPDSSRGSDHGRRGGGSSIQRRTPAGSSTRPSTSSRTAVSA